jgi:hypothetical protein
MFAVCINFFQFIYAKNFPRSQQIFINLPENEKLSCQKRLFFCKVLGLTILIKVIS